MRRHSLAELFVFFRSTKPDKRYAIVHVRIVRPVSCVRRSATFGVHRPSKAFAFSPAGGAGGRQIYSLHRLRDRREGVALLPQQIRLSPQSRLASSVRPPCDVRATRRFRGIAGPAAESAAGCKDVWWMGRCRAVACRHAVVDGIRFSESVPYAILPGLVPNAGVVRTLCPNYAV
jgi:hypothetical protein